MAAKVPSTLADLKASPTTIYYVDPASGNPSPAFGEAIKDHQSSQPKSFCFPDIDNGDTWASGIKGITDYAYREDGGAGTLAVALSGSTFTFTTSASDLTVILTIWAR